MSSLRISTHTGPFIDIPHDESLKQKINIKGTKKCELTAPQFFKKRYFSTNSVSAPAWLASTTTQLKLNIFSAHMHHTRRGLLLRLVCLLSIIWKALTDEKFFLMMDLFQLCTNIENALSVVAQAIYVIKSYIVQGK